MGSKLPKRNSVTVSVEPKNSDTLISGVTCGIEPHNTNKFDYSFLENKKFFRVESYDPKYCQTVIAEDEDDALFKVLGHRNGDNGFTFAKEIKKED